MSAILALTGQSGSGKTTVAGELLRRTDIRMVPSVTTRERRESDLPGEYEYVSREGFEHQVHEQFFLWHVTRGSTSYGTDRNAIFDICDQARGIGIMILVPEKVRPLAEFVRGQYGSAVPIIPVYFDSPGEDVLRRRLIARGESLESIEERMHLEASWPDFVRSSSEHFHIVQGGETLDDLPQTLIQVQKLLTGL